MHVCHLLQCKQTFCSPSERLWSNIICELPHLCIAKSGAIKLEACCCLANSECCTSLANGSFLISSSVLLWYLRISRSATVPGRYLKVLPAACNRGCPSADSQARQTTIVKRSRPTYVDHVHPQCVEYGPQPRASSLLESWWVQLSSACPQSSVQQNRKST